MTRAKTDPDCAIAPPDESPIDIARAATGRIKLRPPTGPAVPARAAVGDEERVDATDEQAMADTRHADFTAAAAARARDRRKARARLTLGQRLDNAVAALETLSTVGADSKIPRAGELGIRVPRTAVDEQAPGPPRAQPPPIAASLTVIERQVERIEATLDSERGLLHGVDPGRMTTADLDRLVWTYMGVRARDVAAAAPYLGSSPRSIMRAREREAMRRGFTVNLTTGDITGRVFEGEDTAYEPDVGAA